MTAKLNHLISKIYRKNNDIEKLILISFFFSGVCEMIYVIVWIRLLYPLLGSPLLSMSTVLSIFIGGLALGNFFAGRYIDLLPDPLKTYGIIEGALGIYCLFLPWFIQGLSPIYAAIYQNIPFSFYSAVLLRFLVSASILLIPAAFIGFGWPLASKLLTQRPNYLGQTMSKVYSVHALGAFLGASAAGLFFIPYLGIYPTLSLGIIITLFICIFILLLVKEGHKISRNEFDREQTADERLCPKKEKEKFKRIGRLVLIGYGFSGLAVIMYLFIWLKVFVAFAGSFFCALCLPAAAFILGLALGSLSPAKFINKKKDFFLLLGIIELALGLSFLGIIPLLSRFPLFMAGLVNKFPSSFLIVQIVEFFLLFLIMLVPSFLTGFAFPLVCRIYTDKTKTISQSIANILAANTFGGFMGIVLGGLLVVQFGIVKGSLVAVFSHLCLGTVFLILSPSFPKPAKGIIALLIVGALPFFFLPNWEPPFLKNKPCQFIHLQNKGIINKIAKNNDLSHQLLLTHIPLLLHCRPQKILFMGQLTTMSLDSIKQYPVQRIDLIPSRFNELCPKVVNDPKLKLIREDIRHHLRFSNKKYDIIISQPIKAFSTDRPDLFTIEFFQLCRQSLRPGGIAVTRLTTQNMHTEIFKSILYTWHKVFPFVSLWETNLGHDYLLIGSDQKIQWHYPLINNRLQQAGITSDHLLSCFFMDEQVLPTFCRGSRLFTDDYALTDSFALKLLYQEDSEYLIEEMQPYRGKGLSPHLAHLQTIDTPEGIMEKKINKRLMAKVCFTKALLNLIRNEPKDKILRELKKAWQLNPDEDRARVLYMDTLFAVAEDYSNQKLYDLAVLSLMEITKISPDHLKARFLLGKTYYNKGYIDQAVSEFERVLKSQPDNEEAHCQLGIAYLNSGWIDPSIGEFTQAIQINPDYPDPHLYLGAAYFKKDLLFEAIEEYEKATALNPDYADAHYNLGIAYLKKGLVDEAISEWKKVIKIRPNEVNGRYNLALAYLNYGEIKKSIHLLEEILHINPNFIQAKSLLTNAYQMREK